MLHCTYSSLELEGQNSTASITRMQDKFGRVLRVAKVHPPPVQGVLSQYAQSVQSCLLLAWQGRQC
jgi:hypothetical protein